MQQLNDSKHFRIRACATPYIVFGLLLGFVELIWLLACFQGWQVHWDRIGPALIPLAIFAAMFFWLKAFDISLEGDTIYYSTLFSRKRCLSLAEISTTRLEGGLSARGSGFFRLVVEPYPYTGKDPIEINLTVFSRASLKPVFDLLSSKMPDTNMKAARDT
jgi:hypothetical protein